MQWYFFVVLLCISLITKEVKPPFHKLFGYLDIIFCEVLTQAFCPFFYSSVFFFLLYKSSSYILHESTGRWIANIFFPLWLAFLISIWCLITKSSLFFLHELLCFNSLILSLAVFNFLLNPFTKFSISVVTFPSSVRPFTQFFLNAVLLLNSPCFFSWTY